jgi:hypothetical protein
MIGALLDPLRRSSLFRCVAGGLAFALRRNGAPARYSLWFAASMHVLAPVAALTALVPRAAASGATSRLLLPLSALAAPAVPSAQAQVSSAIIATPAEHARLLAEQPRRQKEEPFNPADFDKYATLARSSRRSSCMSFAATSATSPN